MGKKELDPIEELFLDDEPDRCNTGCGRCCGTFWGCHPLGIYLVPFFIFLIVGVILWVLFFFNLLPWCNPSDASFPVNGTECKNVEIAGIKVANIGLFLMIVTLATVVLAIICIIVWAGLRACSGRRGTVYRYAKDCYNPTLYILWSIMFFITYNIFIQGAKTEQVIYDVAWFIFIVMLVISIMNILWVLCSVAAVDALNKKLTSLLRSLKAKYRLLAPLFKIDLKKAGGLGGVIKGFKNKKKAEVDDVTETVNDEEMVDLDGSTDIINMNAAVLTKHWNLIVPKGKDTITRDDLIDYVGDKKVGKGIWKLFDTNESKVYYTEFENSLLNLQYSTRRTINDIDSRQFLASIVTSIIRGIFLVIGIIVILLIFGVGVADLLTGIGVIMMALGFTIGGAVNNLFANFIFLLTANAYGVGDWVSIGSEEFAVTKISLGTTYGALDDGRQITLPNSVVSGSRIYNWTRSHYTCVILFPQFSAGTPPEKLDALKAAINQYFKDNKHEWKAEVIDNWFEVVNVTGTKNTMTIQIRCFLRGSNWGRFDVHEPIKYRLLMFIGKACGALGVGFHPGTAQMRTIPATPDNGPGSNKPLDTDAFDGFMDAMAKDKAAKKNAKDNKDSKGKKKAKIVELEDDEEEEKEKKSKKKKKSKKE